MCVFSTKKSTKKVPGSKNSAFMDLSMGICPFIVPPKGDELLTNRHFCSVKLRPFRFQGEYLIWMDITPLSASLLLETYGF